jgi:hypothetical protein
MSKLTREDVLARHAKIKTVPIEGYGDYFLRVLSRKQLNEATERGEAQDKATNSKGGVGRCILAASITDEDGQPLFKEGEEGQVDELDFPVFRALNKEVNKIHIIDPAPEKVAADAKN